MPRIAEIRLKVLVACEFSGIVRDAFRRHGHDSWSCDLLPTERPGPHIKGDVLGILDDGWDLMIAHPPCTYLAVSGAAWFKNPERIQPQEDALDFFLALLNAPIPQIAVENPVSVASTRIRKPDQSIQPYWFGDPAQKTTCLWLESLPKLRQTRAYCPVPNMIPTRDADYPGRIFMRPDWETNTRHLPTEDRRRERSRTFPGIAEAMAVQWGAAKNWCHCSKTGDRRPRGYVKTERKY